MNTIKVKIDSAYGKEFLRPADRNAELFCKIAGAKSLTRNQVEFIKELGFSVEVVPEVTSL